MKRSRANVAYRQGDVVGQLPLNAKSRFHRVRSPQIRGNASNCLRNIKRSKFGYAGCERKTIEDRRAICLVSRNHKLLPVDSVEADGLQCQVFGKAIIEETE